MKRPWAVTCEKGTVRIVLGPNRYATAGSAAAGLLRRIQAGEFHFGERAFGHRDFRVEDVSKW